MICLQETHLEKGVVIYCDNFQKTSVLSKFVSNISVKHCATKANETQPKN